MEALAREARWAWGLNTAKGPISGAFFFFFFLIRVSLEEHGENVLSRRKK